MAGFGASIDTGNGARATPGVTTLIVDEVVCKTFTHH